MNGLVYYVSGHGYGHAVRTAEVLRALLDRRPGLPVQVRTSAPPHIFPAGVAYRHVELDVGVVQPDALRIDESATLARAAELARRSDELVAAEQAALAEFGAALVVVDIPALPCLAASRTAGPVVAVANFSWDWIYRPYVEARPAYRWLIEWFQQAYARADLLLRLPLHGDLSAFRRIEDVPLISRPPTLDRAATRRRLGLPDDRPVVLLSFGGLGLRGLEFGGLAAWPEYLFVATELELALDRPIPNVRLVPTVQENYNDLIAASDVVVTKPGFGTLATCLAEGIPVLYVDRDQFLEYDVLVAGLHAHGQARHIPRPDLLAGRLGPHLDALLRQPAPVGRPAADGAGVIADRLLGILDRGL